VALPDIEGNRCSCASGFASFQHVPFNLQTDAIKCHLADMATADETATGVPCAFKTLPTLPWVGTLALSSCGDLASSCDAYRGIEYFPKIGSSAPETT